MGRLLSGAREYRYLQESIASFPAPEVFADLMRESGLEVLRVSRSPSACAACTWPGRAEGLRALSPVAREACTMPTERGPPGRRVEHAV